MLICLSVLFLTLHYASSRLEYSYCWEAVAMDRRRFRNRDRTQKLGGCKFTALDKSFFEAIMDVVAGEGSLISRFCGMSELILSSLSDLPLCIHLLVSPRCALIVLFLPRVSLQALAQELNFSAYLGLPVFMIPIKGPHNANLARLLLNHIHTGHHTSNVRHLDCISIAEKPDRLLSSSDNCCCPLSD